MPNKFHLQVDSRLAAAEQVRSWFEQLNQPVIPDKLVWLQCLTLLQEGFINIAEHSHKNLPPETPIDIEAVRLDDRIEIRIWSQGPPFDLQQKLSEIPELEDNYDERGRGLKIISEWADAFSYDRTEDNRHCLYIMKCY
ncbi:MAG: anti-sigma regulatory factor [Aphanothece sp. CMT-3BRIN-NPC111]|jgi:serine/threonine-protein kinase RsbW|nr:anti-sigma regulatory factor [Aphanothece sp. CMT-3BRIN-NPC111]